MQAIKICVDARMCEEERNNEAIRNWTPFNLLHVRKCMCEAHRLIIIIGRNDHHRVSFRQFRLVFAKCHIVTAAALGGESQRFGQSISLQPQPAGWRTHDRELKHSYFIYLCILGENLPLSSHGMHI